MLSTKIYYKIINENIKCNKTNEFELNLFCFSVKKNNKRSRDKIWCQELSFLLQNDIVLISDENDIYNDILEYEKIGKTLILC